MFFLKRSLEEVWALLKMCLNSSEKPADPLIFSDILKSRIMVLKLFHIMLNSVKSVKNRMQSNEFNLINHSVWLLGFFSYLSQKQSLHCWIFFSYIRGNNWKQLHRLVIRKKYLASYPSALCSLLQFLVCNHKHKDLLLWKIFFPHLTAM